MDTIENQNEAGPNPIPGTGDPSDQDIRMECLRVANGTCGVSTKDHVLDTAKAYYEFVRGTSS